MDEQTFRAVPNGILTSPPFLNINPAWQENAQPAHYMPEEITWG